LSSFRLVAAAVLAGALIVPAAAIAQQTPAPGAVYPTPPARGARHGHHGHHNGLRAALRQLNLSSTQQQQIDQALARTKDANRNADRATRKANVQKLRADVDAILTPAQRTQLQAAMRRMREQRQQRGFATPAPGFTPSH
jgi:Spy/CpxP family protein refolding chaperone